MDTRTDTSRRKCRPYHRIYEACNFQPIPAEAASTAALLLTLPKCLYLAVIPDPRSWTETASYIWPT